MNSLEPPAANGSINAATEQVKAGPQKVFNNNQVAPVDTVTAAAAVPTYDEVFPRLATNSTAAALTPPPQPLGDSSSLNGHLVAGAGGVSASSTSSSIAPINSFSNETAVSAASAAATLGAIQSPHPEFNACSISPAAVDTSSFSPSQNVFNGHSTSAAAAPSLAPTSTSPLPYTPGPAPASPAASYNAMPGSQWGPAPGLQPKMSIRSSTITQVFHINKQDRRYTPQDYSQQHQQQSSGFGDVPAASGDEYQAKIVLDVIHRTGCDIETSQARDESLTVMITGKSDKVAAAKRFIIQALHKQLTEVVHIPREHYRFILGPKGKRIQELEQAHAVRILMPYGGTGFNDPPRAGSGGPGVDGGIKVIGTRAGIDGAMHDIRCISDEQSKLAFERLIIPKIYHPFICGPNNLWLQQLIDQTGARINVPPPLTDKDELTISGDKDAVRIAVQRLNQIYEEKKRKCQSVSIEVRKSQHRYVIGPRGSGIAEIMDLTNVSIEVPPLDNTTVETITLRGEPENLGRALTKVYEKANSVVVVEVAAPTWLHRTIIGKRGANIQKISRDHPKVHIEFVDGEDKIIVEGPPEEAEKVHQILDTISRGHQRRLTFAEVKVNPKYHAHVIGKSGSNVARLKNETGAEILVPADNSGDPMIRIEGEREGVEIARREIEELAARMDNERSKDLVIEARYHRLLIGPSGQTIKEIRDKFNQLQIAFPDPGVNSDIVQLRGPKQDVEACARHIEHLYRGLKEENYQQQVHVFKKYHPNIIGKGGQTIRKIREETSTRIDVPPPGSETNTDMITVTGRKPNVEAACKRIKEIQHELINIDQLTVDIPAKFHQQMIGSRGSMIRSISEQCGSVLIRFPDEHTSDSVVVRGAKDDIMKAKKMLLDLYQDLKEASYTVELPCKPEFHRFLIGRGGVNIHKLRDETGARVVFPDAAPGPATVAGVGNSSSSGAWNDGAAAAGTGPPSVIQIIGKQKDVEKAKAKLEMIIVNMSNVTTDTVNIPMKHHKHFVAKNFSFTNQISRDFGEVQIIFPKAGLSSEVVTIRGAKDCVAGAKKRIQETVEDLDAQIIMEVEIAQKHHRALLGPRGQHIQELTSQCDVLVSFPPANKRGPPPPVAALGPAAAAASSAQAHTPPGASAVGSGDGGDQESLDTPPSTSTDSADSPAAATVTNGIHEDVAAGGSGSKSGEDAKPVHVPKPCDIIKITGRRENCELAKKLLLANVPIIRDVKIAFEYHRSIIGQRGQEIRRIMDKNDVNITLPPPLEKSDIVKVYGTATNVEKAIADLNERVGVLEKEKEDRELRSYQIKMEVHHKHHPKIIGRKGQVISRLRSDFGVNISLPERDSLQMDTITIQGYEKNCREAQEEIKAIVDKLESQITGTVKIMPEIHSRIIGAKGRSIRKIMDQFNVDIRFPGRSSPEADLIEIFGDEDNVEECKDHLLLIAADFEQDHLDRAYMESLQKPSSASPRGGGDRATNRQNDPGFVVRDLPWEQSARPSGSAPPAMDSQSDFPTMAAGSPSSPGRGVVVTGTNNGPPTGATGAWGRK